MGGVIGLSLTGLQVLPLSSVMPGPLVMALRLASAEVLSGADVMNGETEEDGTGDDVVGDNFMLKRALFKVVVNVEGADFLFTIDGAV